VTAEIFYLPYLSFNIRKIQIIAYSNTHTHPFNSPFSGTTQVSQYQKGKTNLDFTETRDSEWQWHQLGHTVQTGNHAIPQNSVFYRPDALPAAQPTSSKHSRLTVNSEN